MEIASHGINIQAARVLLNPVLLSAAAATWLLFISGTAGRLLLLLEELSHLRTAASQRPVPVVTTADSTSVSTTGSLADTVVLVEVSETWPHNPVFAPSQIELRARPTAIRSAGFEGAHDQRRPDAFESHLRIKAHTINMGAFRPSVGKPWDRRALQRRHRPAGNSFDDEELVGANSQAWSAGTG